MIFTTVQENLMPMLMPSPEHQSSLPATASLIAEDVEEPLCNQQMADPTLKQMIEYRTKRSLPDDERMAKIIILSSTQYALIVEVLYHTDKAGQLLIIPPKEEIV